MLFSVVYVIENMLFAVAVIACALGTVAELQVRVLGIRFAAYSTLVMISFLLLLFLDCFAELDCFRSMLGFDVVGSAVQLGGEKDEEVHQSNCGKHSHAQHTLENIHQSGCQVHDAFKPCDPFHFQGDDHEQSNHRLAVIERISEEHGRVDIVCAADTKRDSINQEDENGTQSSKKRTAEIVDREFCAAPDLFKRSSQPVVEHTGDQKPDTSAGREDDIGNRTPDFTAENGCGFQGKKVQGSAASKHLQKIYGDIGSDNVSH